MGKQRKMLVPTQEKPSDREEKQQQNMCVCAHTHTQMQNIPAGPMPQNHPLTHLSYSHIPWTPQFSTDGKHMTDERGKMNQRWHYRGEKSIATFFLSSRDEHTALTVTCSTVAQLQRQR